MMGKYLDDIKRLGDDLNKEVGKAKLSVASDIIAVGTLYLAILKKSLSVVDNCGYDGPVNERLRLNALIELVERFTNNGLGMIALFEEMGL